MADDKKKLQTALPQVAPVIDLSNIEKLAEDRSFYNKYMQYLRGEENGIGFSPHQLDPDEYKIYRRYEELSQGVVDSFLHGAFGRLYEKVRGVPTIAPPEGAADNIAYGIGEVGRIALVGAIMSAIGTPVAAAAANAASSLPKAGAIATAIRTATKGAELANKLQKSGKLGKFGVNAVKGAVQFPIVLKVADTVIPPGVPDDRPLGEQLKYDAPTGAVYHTLTRMTPTKSPLLNIILRFGATSLALDTLKGQSPGDERPDWAKVFEYGLNFVFSLSKASRLEPSEAKQILDAVREEVNSGRMKPKDGEKIATIIRPYVEGKAPKKAEVTEKGKGKGRKAATATTAPSPTSQTPPTPQVAGAPAEPASPAPSAGAKQKASKTAVIQKAPEEAVVKEAQAPEMEVQSDGKGGITVTPKVDKQIKQVNQELKQKAAKTKQPAKKEPEVRQEEPTVKPLPKPEKLTPEQEKQRLLNEIKNADRFAEPAPEKEAVIAKAEPERPKEVPKKPEPKQTAEAPKDVWEELWGRPVSEEEKATMSNREIVEKAGKSPNYVTIKREREEAGYRVIKSLRPGDKLVWRDKDGVYEMEVTGTTADSVAFKDNLGNTMTLKKAEVKDNILRGRDTASGADKPEVVWKEKRPLEEATPVKTAAEREAEDARLLQEIANADKLEGGVNEQRSVGYAGTGERGAGGRGAGERREPTGRSTDDIGRAERGRGASGDVADRGLGGSPAVSSPGYEQRRAGADGVRDGNRVDVGENQGRGSSPRVGRLERIAQKFSERGQPLYERIKRHITTRLKGKDDGVTFFAVHHDMAGNRYEFIPRKGETLNAAEFAKVQSDFNVRQMPKLQGEVSQSFIVMAKKQKDGRYRYQIRSTYGGGEVPFEKTLLGKRQLEAEGKQQGLKELAQEAKVTPTIISEKGDIQYGVMPQKSGAHTIIATQDGKEIGRLDVDIPKKATPEEVNAIHRQGVRTLDAALEFQKMMETSSEVTQFMTKRAQERAAENRAARREVKIELDDTKEVRRDVERQLLKTKEQLDSINRKRKDIQNTKTWARKNLEKYEAEREAILKKAEGEGRTLNAAENKKVKQLNSLIRQNRDAIKAMEEKYGEFSYEKRVVPLQSKVKTLEKRLEKLQKQEKKLQNKYNSMRDVVSVSAQKRAFTRSLMAFFRDHGLEINEPQAKKILRVLGGAKVGKQVELEIMFPDELHGMTRYTVPIGLVDKQHSSVAKLRRVAENLFPKIQDPRVITNNKAIAAIQSKAKAENRPLTKAETKAIRALKAKNAAIGDEPYNPVKVVVRDNSVVTTGNALMTPNRIAERFVGAIFQAGGIRKAVAERVAQSGQRGAAIDVRNVVGVMRENPRVVLDALIRELGGKKSVERAPLERVVEVPLGDLEAIVTRGEGGIGEVNLTAARKRRGREIIPEDDIEAMVNAWGESGTRHAERLSAGRVKEISDLGEYKPDLTFLGEMESRMRSGRFITEEQGKRLERIIKQYQKVDADYARYLKELWEEVGEVYREEAPRFIKPDGTIDLNKVSTEAQIRSETVAAAYGRLAEAAGKRDALLQGAEKLGKELKIQFSEGGKEYQIKTLDDVRGAVIDYLSAVGGERRGKTAGELTTTSKNVARDFTEVTKRWEWGDKTKRDVPEIEKALQRGVESAPTPKTRPDKPLTANKSTHKKITRVKKPEDVAEVIAEADQQGKTAVIEKKGGKKGVVLGAFYTPMPTDGKLGQIVQQGSQAIKKFFIGDKTPKAGQINTVEGIMSGLDALVYHLGDNRRIARNYIKLAKQYGKLDELKKAWGKEFSDPDKMLDVFGGRHGVVLEAIDGIPVDFKTLQPVEGIKNLKTIYSGLTPKGFADFELYLLARRVRAEKAKNPKVNTGSLTLEKANEIYEQFHGQYEGRAQDYTKWMNYLCEQLYSAGMLNEATIKYIRENNDYAPLNRVMDKMSLSNMFGSDIDAVPTPVYRFHGSHLPFESPYASAVKFAYKTADAISKNNLAKSLVQIGDILADYEIIKPWHGNPATRPDNVVGINVEGKIKFYSVPKDLAMYMRHIDMVQMTPAIRKILRALQAPARMARSGVTLSPEFTFRNPIKDWISAVVYSESSFNPFTDIPKAIASYMKKDAIYHEFIAAGGGWSTMVKASKLSGVAESLAHSGTQKRVNLNPINFLENISDAVETFTRLGMYMRSRSKGKTPTQAAINARRGTVDFAVSGAMMRYYAPFVAFLNPRIQGFRRLIEGVKEHPSRTLLRGFAIASLPSIALFMSNKDNEDYWRQPLWKRNLFWLVKLPGSKKFLMVPKGDLGMIFGSSVERFLEFAYRRDKSSINSLASALAENALPVSSMTDLIPTSIKPILENKVNKSFFTGHKIVPASQEGLAKEYQYSEYTSPFTKMLGKHIKQSPAKIENIVRGYGGTWGKHALELASQMAMPGEMKKYRAFKDDPFLRSFVSEEAIGSVSEPVKQFMEKFSGAQNYYNTVSRHLKLNPREAATYLKDPKVKEGVSEYYQMKDFYNTISKLRRQAMLLQNVAEPTEENKKKLKSLQRAMTIVAEKYFDLHGGY